MHSATVISKFPEGFVLDSINRKLRQKDIEITDVMHPSKITDSVAFATDLVFVMHEMLSHSEYYRIKGIFERRNKKFLYLSRKSSGWNWDNAIASSVSEENRMAAPKAVKEESFPALIRDFIELRKQNLTVDQCAPHLSKYWLKGAVKGNALAIYLRNIVKRGQCPPEILDELLEQLDKRIGKDASRKSESEYKSKSKAESSVSTTAASSKTDNEWQEIAHLYEQENSKLKIDYKKLQQEIAELKRAATKTPSVAPKPPLQMLRMKSLYKSLEGHMAAAAISLAEMEREINSGEK